MSLQPRRIFSKTAFTLIEFLLGLGIFSVISLSLFGVFWSGLTVQARAAKINTLLDEARWTINRMTNDIENMVFYGKTDFSSTRQTLEGDSHRLEFLVASPEGLSTVAYSLRNFNSGRALVREERPLVEDVDSGQAESQNEEELIEVLSFHLKNDGLLFMYGYGEKTLEGVSWVWQPGLRDHLPPCAVRVELTFVNPGDDQTPWVVQRDIFIPAAWPLNLARQEEW